MFTTPWFNVPVEIFRHNCASWATRFVLGFSRSAQLFRFCGGRRRPPRPSSSIFADRHATPQGWDTGKQLCDIKYLTYLDTVAGWQKLKKKGAFRRECTSRISSHYRLAYLSSFSFFSAIFILEFSVSPFFTSPQCQSHHTLTANRVGMGRL